MNSLRRNKCARFACAVMAALFCGAHMIEAGPGQSRQCAGGRQPSHTARVHPAPASAACRSQSIVDVAAFCEVMVEACKNARSARIRQYEECRMEAYYDGWRGEDPPCDTSDYDGLLEELAKLEVKTKLLGQTHKHVREARTLLKLASKDVCVAALHCAVTKGLPAIVHLLLDHGIDPDCKYAQLTPILRVRDSRSATLLLDRGARLDAEVPLDRRNALHCAAARGDADVLAVLLSRGADIEAQTSTKKRALHLAASEGHDAVVNLLLDHGARPNARAGIGREVALHGAVYSGVDTVVKSLLARGAAVNARDCYGCTPLHKAAAGNIDIMRTLLAHGAAINRVCLFGRTPAHFALWDIGVLRFLLQCGADVEDVYGDRRATLLQDVSMRERRNLPLPDRVDTTKGIRALLELGARMMPDFDQDWLRK